MKWAVVFAVAALMLTECQRPMTWEEMHGWVPRDEYRALHTLPLPAHIQPLVKTRDC